MNHKTYVKTLAGATLITSLAAIDAPVWAQIQIPYAHYSDYFFIPKTFSATGGPQFWVPDYEGAQCAVRLYDENFALMKTLSIDGVQTAYYDYKIEERVIAPGEYDEYMANSWTDRFPFDDGDDPAQMAEDVLLAKLTDFASGYGADHVVRSGDVYTVTPSQIAVPTDEYDRVEYRKIIYVRGSWDVEVQTWTRCFPKYSDEWTVVEEGRKLYGGDTESYYYFEWYLEHNDYDAGYQTVGGVVFTQTLFNSDDKYEYTRTVSEVSSIPDTVYLQSFWRGDSYISTRRELRYGLTATRSEIVSDDGTVLHSFQGWIDDVFTYGGKTYAIVYNSDSDVIYEIDAKSSAIKEVRSDVARMFPTVARHNESITIETTATAGHREVVVTAMDGRVVGRQAIPAGESRVQVRAARWVSGTYDFTVYADGRRIDNGKVIIR